MAKVTRCSWVLHLENLDSSPVDRIDTIDVPRTLPRPTGAADCGARASEACGMYVEDIGLAPDDEHARIHGKGGTVRTVLLDDRCDVALLRLYLARSGYTSGPLFCASINSRGGTLSYDAAHNRRKKYCAAAGGCRYR